MKIYVGFTITNITIGSVEKEANEQIKQIDKKINKKKEK